MRIGLLTTNKNYFRFARNTGVAAVTSHRHGAKHIRNLVAFHDRKICIPHTGVDRSHDNFKFRDFHPVPGIRVLLVDI